MGRWSSALQDIRYELLEDPFTGLPCTIKEYCKSRVEYDRQCMFEKYGHCDGID